MAKASITLIKAIRAAASKIDKGTNYQWGHMGGCNCGHLAQELTTFSKREIHEYAMRKSGDWTDQVQDYCVGSQLPMDVIISTMMEKGLSREDLVDLERLKNQEVRRYIGKEGESLSHNRKEDVVTYMYAWAEMMENELVEKVDIKELSNSSTSAKEKAFV